MAFSNFVLTVVGVGAALLLLRGDVKQTASTLRRNVRQLRSWLEEEEAASKAVKDAAKQLGSTAEGTTKGAEAVKQDGKAQ